MSVYYENFCFVEFHALQFHQMLFETVDYWTKRANKTEVLGLKRDLIEQNKHLLGNWEFCECNPMKIIEGKLFILLLFLTYVTRLLGWLMFVMICLLGAVLR
jgi:hypothetical protein